MVRAGERVLLRTALNFLFYCCLYLAALALTNFYNINYNQSQPSFEMQIITLVIFYTLNRIIRHN